MDESDFQKIKNNLNQVFDNIEILKAKLVEKDAEIAELKGILDEAREDAREKSL